MLTNELPKIITSTVPGPKAAEIIKERAVNTPDAIHCSYPVVMDEAQGAIIKDVDGNLFLDWIGECRPFASGSRCGSESAG